MSDIKETVSMSRIVGYRCDWCQTEERDEIYQGKTHLWQEALPDEPWIVENKVCDQRSVDLCPACSDRLFNYLKKQGAKIQYD
jgi:hypothetical protein